MSVVEYNGAGKRFIAEEFIELKGSGSSMTVARIKQTVGQQIVEKDLSNLKEEIDSITSDGVITANEKQGLKREWSALQSAYTSTAEQFTSDTELSSNPSFIVLRQRYTDLAEIMDKVLADMNSDFVGDEVKEISDDFASVYSQLTVCQAVLNSISDFLKNYYIEVTGGREVLDGIQISAGIYRNGIEQQNPEYIDGNNYTWRRLDESDSWTEKHGKSILVSLSDLPVSPCRFTVTWEDKEVQETGLSIVFELTYGTIAEYAWSNALTAEELAGMMPSSWSITVPPQPEGMKYLWRRETSDNRKTYQYFRTTGEQGDKGDTGEQGPQGPPGEDGADGEPAISMMLSSDSYAFTADTQGVVPAEQLGEIGTVSVYLGGAKEDITAWALSAVADPPTEIACSVSADGKISVTAFGASIDSGTIAITATKGTLSVSKTMSLVKARQGNDGEKGEGVKYWYKWTKTDDPDAWKGGGILFSYRNKLFAVGRTLLGAGMAGWSEHIPEGPQYADDFLWMKIVYSDGTYDIIPPAKRGEPAYDIRIVSSSGSESSYQMSSRGVVLEQQDFTFTLERLYVYGKATWSVEPSETTNPYDIKETRDESNPDVFKVSVLAGSSLPYFVVSVSCEDFEITRTRRFDGVPNGQESPEYLKVYPLDPNGPYPIYVRSTDTLNMNNSVWPSDKDAWEQTPQGPLRTGDYILYLTDVRQTPSDAEGNLEPIPYTWVEGTGAQDEGHWKMLDEDDPTFAEAMSKVLFDATKAPNMPVSTGAVYGFFRYLAAFYLTAQEMVLNRGGSFHSDGYAKGDIENNPGKQGFFMGADGYAEFQNMIARGIRAVGSFEAINALKTVDQKPDIDSTKIKEEYRSEWNNISSVSSDGYGVVAEYHDAFEYDELNTRISTPGKLAGYRADITSQYGYYYSDLILAYSNGDSETLLSDDRASYRMAIYDYQQTGDGEAYDYLVIRQSSTLLHVKKISKSTGRIESSTQVHSGAHEIGSGMMWEVTNSRTAFVANYGGGSYLYSADIGNATGLTQGGFGSYSHIFQIVGVKGTDYAIAYYASNYQYASEKRYLAKVDLTTNTKVSEIEITVYSYGSCILYTTNSSNYVGVYYDSNAAYADIILCLLDITTMTLKTDTPFTSNPSGSGHAFFSKVDNSCIFRDYDGKNYIISDITETPVTKAEWPNNVPTDELASPRAYIYSSSNLSEVYMEYETYSNIIEFFSSVIPKMLDASDTPFEPLGEMSNVTLTLIEDGQTYQIERARFLGGIMTLADASGTYHEYTSDQKDSVSITLQNMVIHGQLPSLEIGNAYPVERTDGTTNSSIGSESRKFEDMWAERFNGSLEGYISYNSLAQRNENAMLATQSVVIASHYGAIRRTTGSGTLTIGNAFARLYSNGIAEVSFKAECDDDTIGYVYIPVLFSAVYSVQASAYRDDKIPSGSSWPGLGNVNNDAAFNAIDNGTASVSGSSHTWTRILVMNDNSAVAGYVTVTGMMDETQYNSIIAAGGSMDSIFDVA